MSDPNDDLLLTRLDVLASSLDSTDEGSAAVASALREAAERIERARQRIAELEKTA